MTKLTEGVKLDTIEVVIRPVIRTDKGTGHAFSCSNNVPKPSSIFAWVKFCLAVGFSLSTTSAPAIRLAMIVVPVMQRRCSVVEKGPGCLM